MAKRIYTYYGIKIIDENGENFIKLNGNVNTSSYSEMKKSYHKAKMKNKDRNCKVQLIGLFSNGEEGAIIYEKEFIKETMVENKELLTPLNDIVAEIKYNLDLIQRKREYHYSMMSVYDKKKEVELHKIEALKNFKGDLDEKRKEQLKIMDNLETLVEERRFNKEESSNIKSLYARVDLDLIIEEFNKVRNINAKNYEYIDEELEEKIIKEIPYKNHKERIHKMTKLKPQYDKIFDDNVRKVIVCINKGYHKNK